MAEFWLGLDFETTGLNVETDSIIEIGAVLWDVGRKAPVVQYGALINVTATVSDEITRITGITQDDLSRFGVGFQPAMTYLQNLAGHASHIVAHNGTRFDRPILEAELRRYGIPALALPWIDSSVDIDFAPHISTRKLSYLATEHGFMNPFAHRAVSDVLTMMKIVGTYDPEEVKKWAASSSVTLRAMVSYDDRLLASARGYRWDASRKYWLKTLKEFKVAEETTSAPFKVALLEEEPW